jgi:hypothetical protein
MAKMKAVSFDFDTFEALTAAAFVSGWWQHPWTVVKLTGEEVLVYCQWRWGHGVVLVVRTPAEGCAETFFARMPRPEPSELEIGISKSGGRKFVGRLAVSGQDEHKSILGPPDREAAVERRRFPLAERSRVPSVVLNESTERVPQAGLFHARVRVPVAESNSSVRILYRT